MIRSEQKNILDPNSLVAETFGASKLIRGEQKPRRTCNRTFCASKLMIRGEQKPRRTSNRTFCASKLIRGEQKPKVS